MFLINLAALNSKMERSIPFFEASRLVAMTSSHMIFAFALKARGVNRALVRKEETRYQLIQLPGYILESWTMTPVSDKVKSMSFVVHLRELLHQALPSKTAQMLVFLGILAFSFAAILE